MTEVLKAGVLSDEIDLGALAHNAAEQAEEFVRKVRFVLITFYVYNFAYSLRPLVTDNKHAHEIGVCGRAVKFKYHYLAHKNHFPFDFVKNLTLRY